MIDLNKLRREREKCIEWKNIKPRWEAIRGLPKINDVQIKIGDSIEIILNNLSLEDEKYIYDTAKLIQPWRKGPFQISTTFIDSEWQSFIKYNLIKPYFDLKDKIVGDIGCNNGYYLFRMLKEKPKKLVGFDPLALYKMQFDFINHFVKSEIVYELLGVEHLEFYEQKFDTSLYGMWKGYDKKNKIDLLLHIGKAVQSNYAKFYFLYFDDKEIIHFSYSGYYKCINDIKIMDIKPKIMEQNYVNYLSIKSNNLIPNSSDFIVSVIKNFLR